MGYFVPNMQDLPITDGRHPPDVVGPWAYQAATINAAHGTEPGMGASAWRGGYYVPVVGENDVGDMIRADAMRAQALNYDVPRARTVNLGRVSGSLNRVMSVGFVPGSGMMPGPINPAAYGSTNGGLGALTVNPSPIGTFGLRRFAGVSDEPWYKNPWVLAGGAAVLGVGAWMLLRKRR